MSANRSDLPSDANVTVVRCAYEAYRTGDIASVFGFLHPEVEFVQTELLPWGGVHAGHAGAPEFHRLIRQHTKARPIPEQFVSAGDCVAVTGRLQGNAVATGLPIDMAIVHVWTFREGLVIRFAAYIDTPAMLQALGER